MARRLLLSLELDDDPANLTVWAIEPFTRARIYGQPFYPDRSASWAKAIERAAVDAVIGYYTFFGGSVEEAIAEAKADGEIK